MNLGPLVISALFSYLALNQMWFFKKGGKAFSVALFFIVLGASCYGSWVLLNISARAFPDIADKAIPSLIGIAKTYEIEVTFTDYESLRETTVDFIKGQTQHFSSLARFARGTSTQALYLLAGCVMAVSFFLTPGFHLEDRNAAPAKTAYTEWGEQLGQRFRAFYRSFVTVMGAQILISAVNTVLTSLFVLSASLPYAPLVIGLTFLCGLLPVIGNLISNTVIVGIGLTISPRMALIALVFLITIHKLEYFLNSRIIGQRIRNPFWMTLLGLIVGERLMGIPGIILAPVILNYIRVEASQAVAASKSEGVEEVES
jgi:predicted PurR-regulated permease PerM